MTHSARNGALERLKHSHDHGGGLSAHEHKTRWVVGLTFAMMVAELVAGYATNSLALTADGWHMATHASALSMAALAYWFARKQAGSHAFSFGTGKVHALAGYTSAVFLALVAVLMVAESLRRFFHPVPIAFSDALPVAVLGLIVNLVSVKLLQADEHHQTENENEDDKHQLRDHRHGHDHNLRAAYFHVLADALTSILAILALLGGRYFGWGFLDAIMGIVGGVIIARWSYGLCRDAATQLLDVVPSRILPEQIRRRIEQSFDGAEVIDLHLWDIGPRARACILSIADSAPRPPAEYRDALATVARLEHVTIEVHPIPASPGL